jgi:hypothetical protein
MPNFKHVASAFCMFVFIQISNAQLGFSHEVGVVAGPVQFRSDFGSRDDSKTNFGNSGFGIGLVHYINFTYQADCNCYTTDTYFNDHFKIRNELSYNKTNLEHLGFWVLPDKVSTDADKLRAHKGVAENFDIGTQLEFFPLSIRDFQGFAYSLAPYVSIGVHYTSFNPKASTTYNNPNPDLYGNVNELSNIYSNWFTGYDPNSDPYPINTKGGSTWSTVASVGVRYKLDRMSDLVLDLRWQYYFNDWVDGLNHNWRDYNKSNDWLVWLNVGYIYYLD